MLPELLQDRAALYVSGAMGPEDRTQFELLLEFHQDLQAYVERVAGAVEGAPLWFMTSAGQLVRADAFRGKDAVVSGPAGGVVGVAETAQVFFQPPHHDRFEFFCFNRNTASEALRV